MSPTQLISRLCLGAAAATLGLAASTAHAGGVSVDLNIGVPVLGNAIAYGGPVGAISVGYRGGRGGHYRGGWRGGWGPAWGVVLAAPWVVPTVVLAQPQTVVIEPPAPPQVAPSAPSRPEPVIYPRNGQTPQQLEADRQECNRWATTQPAALADSSVFMRAVDACMDGRGYTTK